MILKYVIFRIQQNRRKIGNPKLYILHCSNIVFVRNLAERFSAMSQRLLKAIAWRAIGLLEKGPSQRSGRGNHHEVANLVSLSL